MSDDPWKAESLRVDELARALSERGVGECELALVLGSGLGPLAEAIDDARVVPYGELPHLPASRVPGHEGRLVIGTLEGRRVVCQQGRVHLYEGWSAAEVTRCVRAFAAVGVPRLFLTNAAGGLRATWPPGTLMLISDHVNLQSTAPLPPGQGAISDVYCGELQDLLRVSAIAEGIELEEGIYVALLGPNYESPAEVAVMARLGAGAVGMSTAQEAIAGAHAGMRVVAISCLTNQAAGIAPTPPNHAEVVREGALAAERFTRLLRRAIASVG
ncbi:MAG: purine-nucleoside phosphorylase [Planctomycetota bacterium]